MSDDLELLIGRYLEGTASAEEVERLDQLLRSDPAVRKALLDAARQTGDLRSVLTRVDRPKARPARAMLAPVAAAAAFLILTGLVVLYTRKPAPPSNGTAAAPVPPAVFPENLKGWQVRSGKWTVQDGILRGESTETAPARIESEAEYGDFDLTCFLRLTGTTTAEVQIRSYSWFVGPSWTALQDWAEIRINARGKNLQAFVNGAPFTLIRGSEDRPVGTVAFYTGPKSMKLEIRDLRIKEPGAK